MLYFILALFILSKFIIHYSQKYNIFLDCSQSNEPQRFHSNSTPCSGRFGIVSKFLLCVFGPNLLMILLIELSEKITKKMIQ